jgi:superfamily II DNA or RNA helicase
VERALHLMCSVHSSSLRHGDAVRVRGERWRVTHLTPHGSCTVVEVAGSDSSNGGSTARFVLPFETVDLLAPPTESPRVVGPAAWRHAARAALTDVAPRWTSLRSAARARITLLAYQLEPAIALNRGLACRVLLADEVGLGKTIQAGLIAAELLARERDARVLIVTPAGLREQWRDELHERFGLHAEIVDAAALARAMCELPSGVNPWAIPAIAIASIDFLKRGDVIRSLETLVWDLVAFDEAHALCGRSDRAVAAELVAARARRVVTITATPHSGDQAAFDRLCALGRLGADDEVLVFRRSRIAAGVQGRRRMRVLAVAPTPEEIRMHRALSAYADRVRREAPRESAPAAQLAMIVLARRACSSAASLARSIERRLALLADPSAASSAQIRLPFGDELVDDDDERVEHLGARGLDDHEVERRLLERVLSLARAVRVESKIAALARMLRRAHEPALVFTEFRDTLQHLASVLAANAILLHGGLSPRERGTAARAFTRGTSDLLLATDAASEGLNLHHRCRLVINLDVPWTPLRLEQRVGRVDRLGQSRTVHAITFVARETADVGIASMLRARRTEADRQAPFGPTRTNELRIDAEHEAQRLEIVRRLGDRPTLRRSSPRPVLSRLGEAPQEMLLALRFTFVDDEEVAAWETIAGAVFACGAARSHSPAEIRASFRRGVHDRSPAIAARSAALHEEALAVLRADLTLAITPLLDREQRMLEQLAGRSARLAAALVQPGLFDKRALRDALAQRRIATAAQANATARVERLRRRLHVRSGDRHLVFALVRGR